MGHHYVAVREDGLQIWWVEAKNKEKHLWGFFQTGGCRSVIYRKEKKNYE
jgi:hypothetical protein